MNRREKSVFGGVVVGLLAAIGAAAATYGLLWLWLETWQYEGTRGEAARAGFMMPVITVVLGSAVGVLVGRGAAWAISRSTGLGSDPGRVAFYAAPVGAVALTIAFLTEAI